MRRFNVAYMEIRGFEPLTSSLQSWRSSQLSYIPCREKLMAWHHINITSRALPRLLMVYYKKGKGGGLRNPAGF